MLAFLVRTKAFATAILALGSISGCTGYNQSLQTLQFSSDTDILPADYRKVAESAVSTWSVARGQRLEISQPQTIVGKSPYDPKRRYVCVRGIEPPAIPVPPNKSVLQSVDEWFDPPGAVGVYEIIVVFDGDARPETLGAFDAGLCKHAVF